ncbi:secreted trypsin-like serine protease [Amycolatopsis lexingtonensis]|uniref:Secreted trypsin-like serine protease n=1 Tax=Amycolatopsis lexingtonensis TaxID=218822 RepID=A0ABR9I9E9_9PSEU|nr:trypsin-like serine protease [Amycolatopsis lexingtonensis]MBE1499612.1 secreted trypsin-like serine protease [Amycolatopsis lexingtonensis]
MRLRALLAAAVLTITAAPTAWAVAHGSDVPPGQFGFVAKLSMTKIPRPDGSTYASYCTGALIAPGWVLTTGHCFHDAHRNRVSGKVPYPTTVTLGLVDEATESGVARKATEVLQAKENDVALIRLDTPVTTVTPLAVNRTLPKVGQQLTLAGWGSLTAANPVPAQRLQQGTVAVAKVDPTTLGVRGAAPEITTSACTYDSGAPYFTGGKLVAVEATGPGCPHAGIETTSRADVIADWITTHTA